MLKIYLCTIKYEIHNENKVKELATDSDYVIINEDEAVPETIELGAYTVEAQKKYVYASDLRKKKKGMFAYFYGWPYEIYLREWDAPNAKLVIHLSYEEAWCSMKRLMELPANDVIAYLKQEGMNLVMPS